MTKVLIVKLGYSETLDSSISRTTSLGDVLRTTVILHYFRDNYVVWLVDKKAYPLLRDNPLIGRVVVFDKKAMEGLRQERFEILVNLEKGADICAFCDSLNAAKRFGFRLDPGAKVARACDGAEEALNLCLHREEKKHNFKFWQDALTSILGDKWDEQQEYILGYQPRCLGRYDIGFNWITGSKWQNKAWPRGHWQKLEKILRGKYTISWQRGLNDLYDYMDWLSSCRLIVTNDSLGMHLALPLNKKIVALFGPTSSREVCLYHRGVKVLPDVDYDCIPCLETRCLRDKNCMQFISPEAVQRKIEELLPPAGVIEQKRGNGQISHR